MEYRWNPEDMTEVLALPAAVADKHIRLAGSAQLKVLLWLARQGKGTFDAKACGAAIGLSPADCSDALQFWLETGVLLPAGGTRAAAPVQALPPREEPPRGPAPAPPLPEPAAVPQPRPRAVKPQMKEVLDRQRNSPDFAYLLDSASARLGRPVSHGDMETLLYLYETAGLPVEVILMVIAYAVSAGKGHMRYIEKVALDWADKGIDTIAAAEEHLCRLEHRRQAWDHVAELLELDHTPTVSQSDAAERWVCEWHMDDGLIRLAYDQCREKTGKFQSTYMHKILEHWRADGVDTVEKAQAGREKKRGKAARTAKETSFDLQDYADMVRDYTPVYQKG